jgi:hypothetical protein
MSECPSNGYFRRDSLVIRDDIPEKVGVLEMEIYEVAEIPKTDQRKSKVVVPLQDQPFTLTAYQDLIRSLNRNS